MKDLVIKADQWEQITAYLQDQPYKFSAPLVGFFQQIITEQNAPAVENLAIAPQEVPAKKGK